MTAQVGDSFRYAGEDCALFANPLEQYFAGSGTPRPAFERVSTANWRGYVARWVVVADVLYLTGLRGRVDGHPFGLRDLFPAARRRVRAEWVSDVLRVPRGACVGYVHMGYASTYERDLFLHVWAGRVVLVEEYENPPARPERDVFADPDDETVNREVARRAAWGDGPRRRRERHVTRHLEAVFGPDEAPFLRAVRADPDARTPRLVYADWLDDRDDPRAGFVRHEEARPPAGADAAAWERERAEHLGRVKHWLWLKLMGYPLPRNEWGRETLVW